MKTYNQWLKLAMLIAGLLGSASVEAVGQSRLTKVYTLPEREPEFPGGKAALSRYLASTIKIPGSLARHSPNTGPISARFIIDADGSVRDVRILTKTLDNKTQKSLQGFMASIISSVEQMPRWKPGQVDGKPVPVFYTLPIEVALD